MIKNHTEITNKKNAMSELQESLQNTFARHYSQNLSDKIKMGIRAKKIREQQEQKLYKFIHSESMQNQMLIYPIVAEDFEEMTHLKLTDKNLYRIFIALTCFENVRAKMNKILVEVLELATDDTDPIWNEIDEQYYENYECGQDDLACKPMSSII